MKTIRWLLWTFRPIVSVVLLALVGVASYAYIRYPILRESTQAFENQQDMVVFGNTISPETAIVMHIMLTLLSFFLLLMSFSVLILMGQFFVGIWETAKRMATFSERKKDTFAFHTENIDGNDILFEYFGATGERNYEKIMP